MPTRAGMAQINLMVPDALAKKLDVAVERERADALTGRISRSSVIRDALIAHLADLPAPARRRATVAPR